MLTEEQATELLKKTLNDAEAYDNPHTWGKVLGLLEVLGYSLITTTATHEVRDMAGTLIFEVVRSNIE